MLHGALEGKYGDDKVIDMVTKHLIDFDVNKISRLAGWVSIFLY